MIDLDAIEKRYISTEDIAEDSFNDTQSDIRALIMELRRLQEIERHLAPVLMKDESGVVVIGYYVDSRSPERKARFRAALDECSRKFGNAMKRLADL